MVEVRIHNLRSIRRLTSEKSAVHVRRNEPSATKADVAVACLVYLALSGTGAIVTVSSGSLLIIKRARRLFRISLWNNAWSDEV